MIGIVKVDSRNMVDTGERVEIGYKVRLALEQKPLSALLQKGGFTPQTPVYSRHLNPLSLRYAEKSNPNEV